ncbi:hypothetical protein K432DRAFT_186363 [Lepidopterella palustris CBS 459.81]|uniref:Uncharacterized protein n=1 Tax=Lepidopterella palustris CBS 459.81 TaxID=1314670 RepID=A0A8E2JL46_9PEZI|nr:hypothetical protein K432DRAFT_186363 [Lepidopterella palustris CBS 459.81]
MQYFVPPLTPAQQTTHSLRASQCQQPRKRKRDEDKEEPPISAQNDVQITGATSNTVSRHSSFASLTAAETAQLRVAGLFPEDEIEIPPAPFPHAPAPASKEIPTAREVQQELAELHPPLYAVNATSRSQVTGGGGQKATALRQTHLSILTTILHHCLHEGDYDRAGRAWGMLLRSQVAGRPIDIRVHGRWGIGAEILLRRSSHQHTNQMQNLQGVSRGSSDHEHPDDDEDVFSEEGFQLARDYYRRLIVQHPNRKSHPHSIDDRTFYPVMFSLWVYEVSERSKRARRLFERIIRQSDPPGDNTSEGAADSLYDDARSPIAVRDAIPSEEVQIRYEAIRQDELRRAREIAQRLDHLLVSPPFDKNSDLLQLRGMVGLWVGDLTVKDGSVQQESEGWISDTSHDSDLYDNVADSVARLEIRKSLADKQVEVAKAQDFFRRARENGGRLWGGINGLGSEADI